MSLRFSRQEHWSGLPCPPPGNLPDPGIEPASLTSPALAGRFLLASRASKAVSGGQEEGGFLQQWQKLGMESWQS